MDVRQLEYLLAVLEHGSLTRAAAQLGISQPALTQSIRRLERRLDVELLERGPRGVAPTEAGRTLAGHARSIALETRLALAELAAQAGRMRGRVRVGAGPSLAASIVPAAVASLLKMHPELSVVLQEGTAEALIPGIESGDIDVAVGTDMNYGKERGFRREMLMYDSLVIAARRTHPLARRREVALVQTLEYRWIMPVRGEFVRLRTEAAFREAGLAPPQPAVETNSGAAIKALLAQDDYLSFVPLRLIEQEEAARILQPLAVAGGSWQRAVHALYRPQALQPAGRLLVSCLRRACESQKP